MPHRLSSVVRVDASAVQGEGAYVEFRRLTWGEQKTLMRTAQEIESSDDKLRAVDESERIIVEHIVKWNWVDDNGQLLPLPTSTSDLEQLPGDEVEFLARGIQAMVSRSQEGAAIKN